MKTNYSSFILALGLIGLTLTAQAAETLKSSVDGITVSNAHLVASGASHIYRGAAPLGRTQELVDMNISEVLIFKNETSTEVQQEVNQLLKAGFSQGSIHQISFPWRNITDGVGACNQVLDGLKILRNSYESAGRNLFFHCTAGQDRTGVLAGLFNQLISGKSTMEVFKTEMCARGYEAGAPGKPYAVNAQIRKNLTPIFVFLSQQIAKDKLDLNDLHRLSCDGFDLAKVPQAKKFVCK